MNHTIRHMLLLVCSCSMMPHLALSQDVNEAAEPTVRDTESLNLLKGGSLDAWIVPSAHWQMDQQIIVGDTGSEKLRTPEWLYTKQRFSDFVFTCELRLTGDNRRNSGIYYRANVIQFQGHQKKGTSFEAPSGYEFDAAFHKPGRRNYRGSLGDWYARPSLRIYPDPTVIGLAYKPEAWNRLTLRAVENRLEYWVNGIKVMDYTDHDPKASREGIIGFQIHDGSVMKVECRNIRVLPLEPRDGKESRP